MNDFHAAEQIALEYLRPLNELENRKAWEWVRDPGQRGDDMRPYRRVPAQKQEWVLDSAHTEERPYGWIFHYTSREFLETGEWRLMPVGHGPLVIRRDSDQVWAYGSLARMHEIEAEHLAGIPPVPSSECGAAP